MAGSVQDMIRGLYEALSNGALTVDATGQGDVPVTLASEVVSVDATGQGDVPVTLDDEPVTSVPNAIRQIAAYTATAAADTAVAITFAAAGEGVGIKFRKVVWSYSEEPTGGALTITDGGTTVFQVNITAAGPGFLPFDDMRFQDNSQVVITLAAGGGTCVGMLNVTGKDTES